MGKAHIDVYARVRPCKKPSQHFDVDYTDHAVAVRLPRDATAGLINNQRENFSFAFSRVLDATITQDAVFDTVAQPVVDSVLEGYNGTIFAYGQTGTGKTFTMEGVAEPAELKGIIPRAFSEIFEQVQVEAREDLEFLVRASYLEIYNEEIRDLLSKNPHNKLDLKESPDSVQ